MASVKTKKRLMYTVFSIIFLFGGIEYAVILPTLWLYLHNTYDAPEYMLGMVLSAYSVAAFLSSPIIGRISDKFRCTKKIFIVCSCFELAGSFLYFIGVSQWLCLGSRFVSGLGAASEAIVLAEVSRYTPERERTSVLSKLVAMRQISLLFGPGLNLFLRIADFKIGPFEVNKYTSPGAFMSVVWVLLILLIMTMYTEPSDIYKQEKEEKDQLLDSGKHGLSTENGLIESQEESVEEAYIPSPDPNVVYDEPFPEDFQKHKAENSSESVPPPPRGTAVNDLDLDYKQIQESHSHYPEVSLMGSSFDIMLSAEKLMTSVQCPDSDDEMGGLVFHESHYGSVDRYNPNEHHRGIVADGAYDPSAGSVSRQHADSEVGGREKQNQQPVNEPYIQRTLSALDDPIVREGKLGFFCNEYIRDEVIAVVVLLFSAMFSQICVETMVTPLSLKYMDFGELENSIMYCLCGVEVILVFVAVSMLSKCVSDRNMMLFGSFLIMATNAWLIYYLPVAPPHNRSKNIPLFAIAVILDVMSLPFLFVCSTSLFSKLTRKQTQGLSQGLRRGVVGLGTILAPLWSASTVEQPHLLIGVLIAIQALGTLMCLLSYKRLKACSFQEVSSQSGTESVCAEVLQDPGPSKDSAPIVRYGSVQRTNDALFSASQSFDEREPLLSNPAM